MHMNDLFFFCAWKKLFCLLCTIYYWLICFWRMPMGIQCTKRIWHGKLSNFYTPHNKNEYLSTHASIVEINYIESDLSFGNKTLNNAAFWSSFVKSAVSNSRGQTQNRMHFFISNTTWTIKRNVHAFSSSFYDWAWGIIETEEMGCLTWDEKQGANIPERFQ